MELPVVRRLHDAINAHDLDTLTGCFAADYKCEFPAHPERGFTGADQVRRNWTRVFAEHPRMSATITGAVTEGHETWSEWRFTWGGRPDDVGVIVVVATPDGSLIQHARFYMEPLTQKS